MESHHQGRGDLEQVSPAPMAVPPGGRWGLRVAGGPPPGLFTPPWARH
jgi:hypothetical protein